MAGSEGPGARIYVWNIKDIKLVGELLGHSNTIT